VSLSGNIIQLNTRYFKAQKKGVAVEERKYQKHCKNTFWFFCSTALKLLSSFEPLKNATC